MRVFKYIQGRVMIYHDTDADGICSAVLMKKYLQEKKIEIHVVHHQDGPRKVNPYMIENIEKYKPHFLIIMDLAYDDDIDSLLKIKEKYHLKKIILVDHHQLNEKVEKNIQLLQEKDIEIIKPQLISSIPPEKYPTSKLTYDILSSNHNIQALWWVAALGIVGDNAIDMWNHSFLNPHLKKHNISMSDLFRAEELIEFAVSADKKNVSYIISSLERSQNIQELIQTLNEYEKIRDEVERIVGEHRKKAYIDDRKKVLLYEISTTYNLRSKIANILSMKYPDYLVVVYSADKEHPERYILSFRNQLGRVNVAQLIKKLSKEIPSLEGGGHKPAAGASISKHSLPLLLKKLKNV